MSWEAFLRKVADENGLSSEQTVVFLVQFDEQHKSKSDAEIANLIKTDLGVKPGAYVKRKQEYYKKFVYKYPALKKAGSHKAEILWKSLEREYSQQQLEPISDSLFSEEWHDICWARIKSRQRLTSNPLMLEDSAMFEREQIYVPLALVQRTKPDKRDRTNVDPEAGTHLYEPQYEETQQFQHDDFLTRILQAGEGKTKGQRIALIGEPGAGKTTLLQAIASWVFSDKTGAVTAVDGSPKSEPSTASQDVAIWIFLADLQGRTLEEYLLQTWLKEALSDVEATPEKKTALGEFFKSGRVWLLLDAVDEMGVGSPLTVIASQLKGWVAKARVVLTCRMNVWQANRNDLEAFETYRLLDFDYPDQVHEFIDKWFNQEPNPLDLAQRLKDELTKTEQVRIRDLVQNPLRLALLCSTWKSWQGSLPETKAGLYEKFVQQFYIWKRRPFPTTLEQRQQLNAGLGRLALRDIEAGVSRFRLTESFIEEELGDPEDPGSLFYLALRLAWLNDVGVAAENPDEKVYAFFHPTFEEYFAALAIKDWHFFLNHVPHNPDEGSYRIFEPRWKEVILLWLGRENVAKAQKEEFIKALVEFEDCSEDFYWYRAYFLAAIGISEFKECTQADVIVDQIVKWGFGDFNIEKQEWQTFLDPIEEGARATIPETNRSRAIAALVELLSSTTDEDTRQLAADNLGTIDPGNEKAIAALVELLSPTTDEDTRWHAADSLGTIDPGQPQAIAALVELLSSTTNEFTRRQAADRLGTIDPGNEKAIAALVELLSSTTDKDTCWQAAESLGKILRDEQFAGVVTALKDYSINYCYKVIWHCAQNLPYPEFYQAWHNPPITPHPEVPETKAVGSPSLEQSYLLAQLPDLVAAAISQDLQLRDQVKLICIDGSNFNDSPALDTYTEICNAGYPQCKDGRSETMSQLKNYWKLNVQKCHPKPILLFYESRLANSFTEGFLRDLSKFGDAYIGIVTALPTNEERENISPISAWGSLQLFSPNQPNLVADIVGWIRKLIQEQ